MSNRTVHFTAPGFRTQLIEVAPNAEEIESKRFGLIENEEQKLSQNQQYLESVTKNKNKEFNERLDEIRSSTTGWEAKLRTEAIEAEESTKQLKAEYKKHMSNFGQSIRALINKKYDVIDNELYPVQLDKVDLIENNMKVCVNVTVPDKVEELVGEVSRQLKKQHEYFDIEQQKENKREKKIVSNANNHLQHTAQKFNDEDALMTARFFAVEWDIFDRERSAARAHQRHFDEAALAVQHSWNTLHEENDCRRDEDERLLDNIILTQQKLQRMVVEHFAED